jgi:hypothetical protein
MSVPLSDGPLAIRRMHVPLGSWISAPPDTPEVTLATEAKRIPIRLVTGFSGARLLNLSFLLRRSKIGPPGFPCVTNNGGILFKRRVGCVCEYFHGIR